MPDSASAITTQTIMLRQRPVALRRAGTTVGPALVLLHGLPTSSFLWRHCLPGLAMDLPGWQIVAPDLPGYGQSAPRPGAGPRHLGSFLHALLAELGITRFVLAGHDLGGLVALTDAVTLALRASTTDPARMSAPHLTRLILLDTTIYPTPSLVLGLLPALVPPLAEVSLAWLGRGGAARDEDRRQRYIAGLRQLLAAGTTLSEDEWAEYARPYGAIGGWREATRSLRALVGQTGFVLHCLAHLHQVTLPVRLIWGEHDPFFPLSTAARLRAALPNAERQIQVIAGAGHFPQEDRPAEVTRLIAEFAAQDQSP